MQIERELLKGVLPMAVMRLLKRRSMYGYELVTEVTQRSDGVLTLGQSTLYPLLYNLEAQGLVESEWQASQGARDRKYYKLTDKGLQRLERDLSEWLGPRAGSGRMAPRGVSKPMLSWSIWSRGGRMG